MRRLIALVPLIVLLVACGSTSSGSSSSSSNSSSNGSATPAATSSSTPSSSKTESSGEKALQDEAPSTDPQTFAKQFYLTWYDALAGRKEASDIMSFFPDSCDFKSEIQTDLQTYLVAMRKAKPSGDKARATDIDFANYFQSKPVSNSYWNFELSIPPQETIKLKAGGQTVADKDYGASFSAFTKGSVTNMLLTKKDNKLFIYEDACASLPISNDTNGIPIHRLLDDLRYVTGASPTPTPPPAASERAPTADEATVLVRHLVSDVVAGMKGIKSAPLIMGLFTSDCQKQAPDYSVAAYLEGANIILFSVKGQVDDVRFQQPFTVKPDQGTYSVTIPAYNNGVDFHIHNGDWISGADYFKAAGLDFAPVTVNIAVVGGKPLISSCKTLTSLSDD